MWRTSLHIRFFLVILANLRKHRTDDGKVIAFIKNKTIMKKCSIFASVNAKNEHILMKRTGSADQFGIRKNVRGDNNPKGE